jgi:hypothetical protein
MSTGKDCACCPPAPASVPSEAPNPPGLAAIAFRLDTQSGFKQTLLHNIGQYPALLPLTTRADDDPAIALADAWACSLDVLTFYQERIANEGFLRTATERRSVLELAREIGYELRPGVAAATELAFVMETAPGAPATAVVPVGTKVQSIPGQNQTAQIFETLGQITAQARWNALRVPSTRVGLPPRRGDSSLFLQGSSIRIQVGDVLLVVGDERLRDPNSERWDVRRVVSARSVPSSDGTPNGPGGYTIVRLDRPLGSIDPPESPAFLHARLFVFRTRANLFGYNAPDWRTMPLGVRATYLGMDASKTDTLGTEISAYPEWPGFTAGELSGAPPGSGQGTGLRGTYYAGENFQELRVERVDATIDFDETGMPWPPAGVPTTYFSVRWEGWVETTNAGDYVFTTKTDDGARLWVDGQLVIDKWILQSPYAWSSPSLPLSAYQKYAIRFEYYQEQGGAHAELSWQIPDGSGNSTVQDPIPATQLYPSDIHTLNLDAVYPKTGVNGWMVLATPAAKELYGVTAVGETACANFAQSAKVTWVSLSGRNLYADFNRHLRDTSVFTDPEELAWAEAPDGRLVGGQTLILTTPEPDLVSGQRVAVSGLTPAPDASEAIVKRLVDGEKLDVLVLAADGSSATLRFSADRDDISLPLVGAAEIATLQGAIVDHGRTQLKLQAALTGQYLALTVRINANLAAASHGDSRQMRVQPETLGSGDGSATFQSFQLKQSPLTYVSSTTTSGVASTLSVRIDDVEWQEVPTLYGVDATARVFTTRLADDASTTVGFGDGRTGARLTTGAENVQAVYRVGIGASGNLDAGQLTLLLSPQLGLKAVTNPIAAAGGTDSEHLAEARSNAPLTVLTLDRIVSLGDFESFASAFAGIGKAQAVWIWNGTERLVAVTVAAIDGATLSDLQLTNLHAAMDLVRPPHQTLLVARGTISRLTVQARLAIATGDSFTAVRNAVVSALLDAFGFINRQFGQPISASELVATMQQVEGVSYVLLDAFGNPGETSDLTGDPIGAQSAAWNNGALVPAEILLLDPAQIALTEITS